MKDFVIVERKHGVSIHVEDPDMMRRDIINLSWMELSGLWWALKETVKNPSFKEREPRAKFNYGGQQRTFVKRITFEAPDDE